MDERLQFCIVTPEREVLSEIVDEVVLPSASGSMGVLPGHAPLFSRLQVGEASYRIDKQRKYLAVSGGFAEVLHDGVTILADTAEPAEEIDADRAQRAKQESQELLQSKLSQGEHDLAEIRLKKALNRISIQTRTGL